GAPPQHRSAMSLSQLKYRPYQAIERTPHVRIPHTRSARGTEIHGPASVSDAPPPEPAHGTSPSSGLRTTARAGGVRARIPDRTCLRPPSTHSRETGHRSGLLAHRRLGYLLRRLPGGRQARPGVCARLLADE